MNAIAELAPIVGVRAACTALGVAVASFYREQHPRSEVVCNRPRHAHPRALSAQEHATVREHRTSERFGDCAPRTVYATLLDEGMYVCHWRTMYRVLAHDAATRERRAVRRHGVYARPELLATAPRQVWSWDSTKLRGPTAGSGYRLYVMLDVFSRAVVGWRVAANEDAR